MSRTGLAYLSVISTLVLISHSSMAQAQMPPLPSAAADHFHPSIAGLMAVDFCGGLSCNLGGGVGFFGLVEVSSRSLKVDALGSIYFADSNEWPVSTCATDHGVWDTQERRIYRVTTGGAVELVGSLRDQCHGS